MLVPSGTHVAPLEQRDLVGKRVAQFLASAHVIRRRFLLAARVLGCPGCHRCQAASLSDLKWTGKAPTFPLFRASGVGRLPRRSRSAHHHQSEPIRYRKYLAFYRLAEALGSKLVPRTGVLAVRLPQLLLALRGDPEGLSLLREDMAVRNDGTVLVMVSEPIVDGHEIDFSAGPEVKSWRMSAESRASVPPERSSLVAGYVEALVLDYLAAANPTQRRGAEQRSRRCFV